MADEQMLLAASVARLRELVESLGPDQLRAQAYPTEWAVDGVLSHLGSGAVISIARLEQGLGGPEIDPQRVWDEWNAKDPEARAADFVRSDAAFMDRLERLSEDERGRFTTSLGPLTVDLPFFIRLRLNEHALHSWDVAVTFDPTATLDVDTTAVVLEGLPLIARFTGQANDPARQLLVRTTTPDGEFVVDVNPDGVTLAPSDSPAAPDIEMPGEAFVRLVYGRLDPDHTPPYKGDAADLDYLRRTFPGV